ncbi:WASH complex subunit 1 [Anastrepha ludens]|uniref:WASH complex subunit 1 n=1 Tax=Anastrepha ludens TaxID=28586 RepID=UPI0023B13242|nr:WASH complex subunit 1 [Anastrepha ludens]
MYTVPVIPPDLRHEETIIQAALALDCLQKTINSIFDRIDNRTQRNNAKVQELSTRIERAQSKIRSLVGTKKSIKIYSPARFPSTKFFLDIPQTFGNSHTMLEQQRQQKQNAAYEVHSRSDAPATQALHEKLVFFHVRYNDTDAPLHGPTVAGTKAQVNKSVGMGVVPEKLRSISSLLHCNSDEVVYGSESVEKDAWRKAKFLKSSRQRQYNSTEQKHLLEPAPHSLAHRNQKVNSFGGLRYTPRLHEAPEIDLPLDLPDLPGIADDIHFEGKDQQQIAPSLYIENLPDLPELEQAAADVASIPKLTAEQCTDNVQPPVPLVAQTIATKSNVIVQLAAVAPPPPPPPPPLPPTQTETIPAQKTSEKLEKLNLPQSNVNNSRTELMDAIRKAGGARGGRLRAAAPVDVVDNRLSSKGSETKLKTSNTGGGDLMADLHNKLLMRRKGISGAKDKENINAAETAHKGSLSFGATTTGNPVMSRLSALIPPPVGRKNSDDDDDDNDTDWVE